MSKGTSGNSGNGPLEGEFERLHQQGEAIDADRDRYDSPGPKEQPEAEPVPDDVSQHDADVAGLWICRALATAATRVWPVLSYNEKQIAEGGAVIAPLLKKYADAAMPVAMWFDRWQHELAAAWFFGIVIGDSIDRVRATKSRPTGKVSHGAHTTTDDDEETLNTETIWQKEAPTTEARPEFG